MAKRDHWRSRLGFILAASGSAIGLGNIVFFGANAYKFGGGAFYVPYLIALFAVGIPVMMIEFGIGHRSQQAFPQTLHEMAGPAGEFVGWWALLNASIITMYYITLLGWVLGMFLGAFGPLWEATHATPGLQELGGPSELPNPYGYFFDTLSNWKVIWLVAIVWAINIAICWRGTRSIESVVKVFVPAMWVTMIVLIVRGLTLPNGPEGVLYLFTPNFEVMAEPEVWRGAFAQIFFSLSLGFGLLTAYASYLPKDSDPSNYALQTSLMNCSFEYIAGFAIFSMLFAFSIIPKASTLAMSFFVLPSGIRELPAGVVFFGAMFFLLLLLAGLSSSVSLVEGLVSAAIDKFRVRRPLVLATIFVVGLGGSLLFAWPKVIDPGVEQNGTLGLTLLDLFDNKAFGYGLLLVGLAECIIVGWVFGVDKLVAHLNKGARFKLGTGFKVLVKFVIPGALGLLLVLSLIDELGGGLYGRGLVDPEEIGPTGAGLEWVATAVPVVWLLFTVIGAYVLTKLPESRKEGA